jgi:hypothetical protein
MEMDGKKSFAVRCVQLNSLKLSILFDYCTEQSGVRRYTRLTNAFSTKLENHIAATALHVAYYNFVRRHQTLRVTPAMAAGVSATLWGVDDLLNATIGAAS